MPGFGTEYKEYDNYGRLLCELDIKEQATGYDYDSIGRLEDKKYYAADASPAIQGNDNYPNTPAEVVHFAWNVAFQYGIIGADVVVCNWRGCGVNMS